MKNKKILITLTALLAMALFLLSGCGKDGKPSSYDYPDLGIRFDLKGAWAKQRQNLYVSPVYGQSYAPISGLIINYQDEAYPDVIRSLVTVAFADMNDVTLDHLEEMIGGPDRIATVAEIGKTGENTYYFCSFPEDSEGLSSEQKEDYLSLLADLETAKANITLSEASYSSESPQITGTVSIPEGTVDLDGNAVSEDLFSEHRLTMINIWGSFCNPCIEEMEMLQKINDELQKEDAAIIGILGDAVGSDGNPDEDVLDLGRTILESKHVAYPNLAMNSELQKLLATDCFPTSVLVDRNGSIVGETIYGAQTEEDYLSLIYDALDQLED